MSFAERYGPWALVAGASEGVGAAYARAMAERGVNLILLARRQESLDLVAAAIRADTGVETRAVAVDLAEPAATATIVDATAGLEVGTVMYCAGADPNYQPFLANPVDVPLALVRRNCVVPMELCHHFAGPMADRGRGGIVLVSSAAALAGAPNMVAYGASKAFDLVMAEALWAELRDTGVNVLSAVLGVTDTPALRRLLARRGVLTGPDDAVPIPGAVTPDEVVNEVIVNLANGPTLFVGEQLRQASRRLRAMTRNEAVMAIMQQSGGVMADRTHAQAAP
ncbi:SDR family NAD(P)-dependent oxidoreductase [Parafrankia sp. FMc6]|uniref:SDR family NAD(P)-dependent oxidoreductase n=1 Tax=Parafrankia soli TaxID=2599596 RepID=UPI0034D4DD76